MTARERVDSCTNWQSIGWMVSGVGLSLLYFTIVAAVVQRSTLCDAGTAARLTVTHALLFAGLMTLAFQRAQRRDFWVRDQFSLQGLAIAVATIAVSLSFATQALRLQVAASAPHPLQTLYEVLFFGSSYFVCSLPFAAFLGNGLYWIWFRTFPDLQPRAKRH